MSLSSLNKERQKFATWSSDRSSADYVCVTMITNSKLGRNSFEGNGVRVCVGVAQMVKTADFPSEFSAVVECLCTDQTVFGSTFFFLRSPALPNVPATVSGSPQAIITLDGPHVFLSFHCIRNGS